MLSQGFFFVDTLRRFIARRSDSTYDSLGNPVRFALVGVVGGANGHRLYIAGLRTLYVINDPLEIEVAVIPLNLPYNLGTLTCIHRRGHAGVAQKPGVALESGLAKSTFRTWFPG